VLECQPERKSWSKVDKCGSKTQNAKLHSPKCERGVLNCLKSIPRGYGMSSSTKMAVKAKQKLPNMDKKMRNANLSSQKCAQWARKHSKSMPDDCGMFSSVKMAVEGMRVVLEGPVSRPVQDRKKTGPRPVFQKTAVLVFQIFK